MGVIAWIAVGFTVGVVAEHFVGGRMSHGLIITCLIGVAGALLGGWIANIPFRAHTLQGFFKISTRITALAGSLVLLGAVQITEGRRSLHR